MERLISACGLFVLVGLAWLMSSSKSRVSWRLVFSGILLQVLLATVILWTAPGRFIFESLGLFFNSILSFVEEGTSFVLGIQPFPGDPPMPPRTALLRTFAFGVLPTVIFFSSLMSILYYVGLMQKVVIAMAWVMQRVLGTSGAESLAAAANVFVGHTEAPLVVRPFIPRMTQSELNALMVGGFATITGGLLAVFVGMGIDAAHLLTASVISAPAALVVAKVMQPEMETPETLGRVEIQLEENSVNVIDAAANGASEGMKLALNIAAMLIAFLALLAMFDAFIGWIGTQLGYVDQSGNPTWTLAQALGYLFSPLALSMGIGLSDCLQAGELLGLKMVTNEVVAFEQLSTWLKDPDVALSARTEYILTYALSGFSNFGAIGIQLGGIGSLAPNRRRDLARFGLRAMLGGAIACCMTGCIAGVLLPK
ncbi:MAG: nucleoside transporter C-terminal domain-containing protein [Pirellulales bacterium]